MILCISHRRSLFANSAADGFLLFQSSTFPKLFSQNAGSHVRFPKKLGQLIFSCREQLHLLLFALLRRAALFPGVPASTRLVVVPADHQPPVERR